MNPALATLALLAFAAAWLALPLLPALIELRRKSDAAPLSILQDHGGDIRYFAHSFLQVLQPYLGPLANCRAAATQEAGVLRDGSPYLLVGARDRGFLTPREVRLKRSDRVFLFSRAASIPSRMHFTRELYSSIDLRTGRECAFRAVLGNGNIAFGEGTTVLRWVHTVGELVAAKDCVLHGRTSSDLYIRLAEGCRFDRLHAPRVELGEFLAGYGFQPPALPAASIIDVPPQRMRVEGNFESPEGLSLEASLVATGNARITHGAFVRGSIKAGKDLTLGENVRVEGAVVSARDMTIGPGCRIHGPILAEGTLTVHAGCILGSEQKPTTLSALRIRIASGVRVHGTIWAREGAQVGL